MALIHPMIIIICICVFTEALQVRKTVHDPNSFLFPHPVFSSAGVVRPQARKALSGLQRMELPFFGTSASWSNRLNGVVVSGNPREGAIQNWQMSEEVLRQSVESELGYPVFLHLLRRAEEEQGELSRPYELLVRDASRTSEGAGAMMAPLISLAAVWWCSTQLDSNTSLQQLGAVIQPGSGTRWHLTLGLVLLGELARTVVASMNGVSIGARTGCQSSP